MMLSLRNSESDKAVLMLFKREELRCIMFLNEILDRRHVGAQMVDHSGSRQQKKKQDILWYPLRQ